MKSLLIAVLVAAGTISTAVARDTTHKLPLAEVLSMPQAQGKLDESVRFYLKGQGHPRIIEKKGEGVTNKKTNGVGKEDSVACRWAALSALMTLQEAAKQAGANAVIDIVSYYKKIEFSSATDYECHAGAVIVGVALKGTYAKVAN